MRRRGQLVLKCALMSAGCILASSAAVSLLLAIMATVPFADHGSPPVTIDSVAWQPMIWAALACLMLVCLTALCLRFLRVCDRRFGESTVKQRIITYSAASLATASFWVVLLLSLRALRS